MADLGARDLDAILEFVLEAQAFEDLDRFREGILPGLQRLVPCDSLGDNEIDLERGRAVAIAAEHEVSDAFVRGER